MFHVEVAIFGFDELVIQVVISKSCALLPSIQDSQTIWVLQFQAKEQLVNFKAFITGALEIIAQKHIFFVRRPAVLSEDCEQILEATPEIANYRDRCTDRLDISLVD